MDSLKSTPFITTKNPQIILLIINSIIFGKAFIFFTARLRTA